MKLMKILVTIATFTNDVKAKLASTSIADNTRFEFEYNGNWISCYLFLMRHFVENYGTIQYHANRFTT